MKSLRFKDIISTTTPKTEQELGVFSLDGLACAPPPRDFVVEEENVKNHNGNQFHFASVCCLPQDLNTKNFNVYSKGATSQYPCVLVSRILSLIILKSVRHSVSDYSQKYTPPSSFGLFYSKSI
mmetsp:Transcript_44207/g.71038  ORF Transcript_44207/g.71038 Transcript_44207/m.71038 type:complete len:124 (+) Transcript_44207:426-797(+)